MANKQNKKSDVKAKQAFCEELVNNRGFESATVVSAPADIVAKKNGETFYFEVKMTKRTDTYFGAATATEWEQAFKTPDRYRFVVAMTDDDELKFEFFEFTPEEFMEACTIPPFKTYFNIDLITHKATKTKHRNGTVALTRDNFDRLNQAYQNCRKN